MPLTPEEIALIGRVLLSNQVQNLMGAEEWDLTEDEETRLWALIARFENMQ